MKNILSNFKLQQVLASVVHFTMAVILGTGRDSMKAAFNAYLLCVLFCNHAVIDKQKTHIYLLVVINEFDITSEQKDILSEEHRKMKSDWQRMNERMSSMENNQNQ